jgi:tetratricopeptide (TPR) repeat protein
VLLQLKDLPAAVKEFKRVLEINPKEPAALNNLARVYLGARRELPEALAMCQKLVASDPKSANYDLLGWALYVNGRTNEAIQAVATAVAQEPANARYQERYRRLRQPVGATP